MSLWFYKNLSYDIKRKSKQTKKCIKHLRAMKNMASPSPALLIPRHMNQYSSSLSTAVKKAWSSFTCLLKNCFAHSPLNLIRAIWMLCMYICHHPLESEWQSRGFLGLPATSPVSGTGSLSEPWKLALWLCVHDRARQDCTWCAAPEVQNSTQRPTPSLRASLRLNFCLVFPNLPDSWVPNWNTHQFSEKLTQNGAAYWANTTLRDFIPHGCFLCLLNKPTLGAFFSYAGRISILLAGKLLLQPQFLQWWITQQEQQANKPSHL